MSSLWVNASLFEPRRELRAFAVQTPDRWAGGREELLDLEVRRDALVLPRVLVSEVEKHEADHQADEQ